MIEIITAQKRSTAAPEAFFQKWCDHATWEQWSPDTEWVHLDGPLALGTRGVMKPKGGPKVRFRIAELEQDRRYTDASQFLGARLMFQHSVTPSDSGSDLEVRVWIEGTLARFWAAVLGNGFRASVPADLDRLINLVESA